MGGIDRRTAEALADGMDSRFVFTNGWPMVEGDGSSPPGIGDYRYQVQMNEKERSLRCSCAARGNERKHRLRWTQWAMLAVKESACAVLFNPLDDRPEHVTMSLSRKICASQYVPSRISGCKTLIESQFNALHD